MFVDEINIKVIAGDGGDGCTSFRREKYVPMGGPDGGDGGRGSNIIFKVDRNLKTLIDLKYQKIIKGKKGENGKGSNKVGKNASDIVIKVPAGTTIIDNDTNLVIVDLVDDNQEYIVAKGGKGGYGNKHFATHQDTAPRISEYGDKGEVRFIKCELKLLADVGIIGLPSVGKSTLLSLVSAAKPKIASYHFTTLAPNLGLVTTKKRKRFIMADLPGLIEGASSGVGLGDKFLRHTARCKLLVHVIDMGASDGRNPIDDYKIINNELSLYSNKLALKKQIVVANKSDLPDFSKNLEKFKKVYPDVEIFSISSLYNKGVDELIEKIADTLDTIKSEKIYDESQMEDEVIFKFKEEEPYTIENIDGIWTIKGKKIERLFSKTKFMEEESANRFATILRKMGVEEKLEEMGAKRGDDVKICDKIFSFKE